MNLKSSALAFLLVATSSVVANDEQTTATTKTTTTETNTTEVAPAVVDVEVTKTVTEEAAQ